MKVFVTGVGGQLGHDVMNELNSRGIEVVGSDVAPSYTGVADAVAQMPYMPLDITDEEAVAEVLTREKPDAVIHCAAWTAVDLAEEHPETVHRVNAVGTRNIAQVCSP